MNVGDILSAILQSRKDEVIASVKSGQRDQLSLVFNGVEIPCMDTIEELVKVRDQEVLEAATKLIGNNLTELNKQLQETTNEFFKSLNKPFKLERMALDEHRSAIGKVILVSLVDCFSDNDSCRVPFSPPKRFRIIETSPDSLCHWTDGEWLDPYWDVEPIDEVPSGLRSWWVYGTSYSTNGRIEKSSDWRYE